MDFEVVSKTKNKHFAREGLQKSNFRCDGYPMLILSNFQAFWFDFRAFLGEENHSKIKIIRSRQGSKQTSKLKRRKRKRILKNTTEK